MSNSSRYTTISYLCFIRCWLVPCLLLFSSVSQAQVSDSLNLQPVSLDSLLNPYTGKLDSLQSSFYAQADSIKQSYKSKLATLESNKALLQAKVDSLSNLRLPTETITGKIDSLNQKQKELLSSLNQKVADLKSKTLGKVNSLNLPGELQEKISSLTKNIDGFQLPVKDFDIPSLSLPDNPLGNLNGLSSSMPSMDQLNGLSDISLPSNLSLPSELSNVSQVTEQIGGYSNDIQNITQGNLEQLQQLPQTLENKAAEVSGLNEITKQAGELDPMLSAAQNPEAMKEQVVQQAQQMAVDHFAGKEKQLQEAMDKIAKLKKKYSSLNSLSEIPKKRPNEMRDKPLVERLLPGIAMQIQKKGEDILTDFNPYIGYRFTGHFTTGLGWNQRVGYNTDYNSWSSRNARVYGPRIYSEYKIGEGFSPRAEIEVMNTFLPPLVPGRPTPDLGSREWVWGAFVGIKKDYRLLKNVKGTALIMFRLFNPDHKSPYADVLNVRFGFEFPMKKKPRNSKD